LKSFIELVFKGQTLCVQTNFSFVAPNLEASIYSEIETRLKERELRKAEFTTVNEYFRNLPFFQDWPIWE